jgi:hypothetical protein
LRRDVAAESGRLLRLLLLWIGALSAHSGGEPMLYETFCITLGTPAKSADRIAARRAKPPNGADANWQSLKRQELAMESTDIVVARRAPWNKGKLVGQKAPLKAEGNLGAINGSGKC